MSVTVSGLVKSSLIDYPGKICCVLFVPYCNFDCFYCHNRQIIEKDADIYDPDALWDFLRKRRGLLDGVVISGGEPTLQKDLIPFVEQLKELDYSIKLDTNGSNPDVVKKTLEMGLCDYYAVDYKAPKARYKEICGESSDAEKVLETIGLLKDSGIDFEVRTTVIPQLTEGDLITMAKELPVVPRFSLNLYRKPEKYHPADRERILELPYTQSHLYFFTEELKKYQPNIRT